MDRSRWNAACEGWEPISREGLTGDIVLVGGAFMTLVPQALEATRDVDACRDRRTAPAIRQAAAAVALREGLPQDWLNGAVKGFFGTVPSTVLWAGYPGLGVNAVTIACMFAMKAVAGRPQDQDDLLVLGQHLGIESAMLIAAAMDQLAWEAEARIEPPAWVGDARYVLAGPWYLIPGWRLRMHRLVDTPEAFEVRDIHGGARIISRA